jgi:hypothetical protein
VSRSASPARSCRINGFGVASVFGVATVFGVASVFGYVWFAFVGAAIASVRPRHR